MTVKCHSCPNNLPQPLWSYSLGNKVAGNIHTHCQTPKEMPNRRGCSKSLGQLWHLTWKEKREQFSRKIWKNWWSFFFFFFFLIKRGLKTKFLISMVLLCWSFLPVSLDFEKASSFNVEFLFGRFCSWPAHLTSAQLHLKLVLPELLLVIPVPWRWPYFKGELNQRSITGPINWNGLKNIHTAVLHSILNFVC